MIETIAAVLTVLFVLLALAAHLRQFLTNPANLTINEQDFDRILHEAMSRQSLKTNIF